ncbi:hypothetical protein thalar_01916 [Litoreibacter arenae DSM 19593]|uniref:Uncharacterized protein n=1 Tax=Litoreibacter arenae DSM 19593 TaxID=1123360 RepID=S9QGZ8_9RHOB|nr:hypothetical protein thalar_01916 [Litoreibacter arenae DSM 19593]
MRMMKGAVGWPRFFLVQSKSILRMPLSDWTPSHSRHI